ncbi:MAG: S9 family peptidase [Chloroflexi bacterium]|nr:S9 family peptidase [Chloroflexota bacterium]
MSKHPIAIDDLFKIKLVSDAQISPDGKTVAFVLTTPDLEGDKYSAHIWLVPSDGSTPARQFTFGEGKDRSPRWSPDGKWIAFASDRDKEKKDQLYRISIDGGEALRLTDDANKPSAPVWSPDGTMIAFTSKVITKETKHANEQRDDSDAKSYTRLNYKSNDEGFWDYGWRQICVLQIADGISQQLTRGMYNHGSPAWSPDSKTLVFAANRSAKADEQPWNDLWSVPAKGGALKRLTRRKGPAIAPAWSPDGKLIAFFGHENEYATVTEARIYVMPSRGGKAIPVSKGFDRTLGSALATDLRSADHMPPTPAWSKDGKTIYFLATECGTSNTYSVGSNGGIVKPVTHGDQHIIGYSYSRTANRFAFVASTPTNPNDVFVSTVAGATKKITNVNADLLVDVQLSKPEKFVVMNEGTAIEGWLMKPLNWKPGRKFPAVLQIHGGPHSSYGETFFHEFQVLCAQGYAVVFCNPRGSAGYGQEFAKCIGKDWGGRDYRDIMAVWEFALRKYKWIDEKRNGVAGGSYGGYMTSWIVTHTDRFKAAVSMRALNNWYSFYGTSDIGHFFASEWYVGGEPWNNASEYLTHSPIAHVANCKTPTLILHSEKDFRCPIEQGEQFYIALKKLGVPTEFVRFPDETHELSRSGKPKHRKERLERIVAWFAKYLK